MPSLKEKIIEEIKKIYDPEIPVDIDDYFRNRLALPLPRVPPLPRAMKRQNLGSAGTVVSLPGR